MHKAKSNSTSENPEWEYYLHGNGINEFHENLYWNKKCDFSYDQWNFIFRIAKVANDIHAHEERKTTKGPYITHPIQIVFDYIKNTKNPHWKSIVILIMHDSLESRPNAWKAIYEILGIDLFLRILKLSKLPNSYRQEIAKFFGGDDSFGYYSSLIRLILDPNPIEKEIFLRGLDPAFVRDYEKFEFDYISHLDTHFPGMNIEKRESEIHTIWMSLFFDNIDALHKWYDTRNNLQDIHQMDLDIKRRYILRRVPKLNLLKYILSRYGMTHHVGLLHTMWMSQGGKIGQAGEFTLVDRADILVGGTSSATSTILA